MPSQKVHDASCLAVAGLLAVGGLMRGRESLYMAAGAALGQEILQVSGVIEAKAEIDPQARLLMSLPGIGPYSALLIWAEIGEIERFSDPRKLVSYAGLAPSVYASGTVLRYGRITK